MIELLHLRLKDIVYFKSVSTSLTSSSLTFVRGLNQDSDQVTPSSNGAGKSLLFSTIPNLLYFSPPLSIKKKAKKEILSKGSSITLKLRTNSGEIYRITQKNSGYTIIGPDGTDMGVSRIPVAEKMIRDIFPISEVLFYTVVFVSTQKSFPMQQSTDAARLEYLVDMFTLDQYDKLREYFSTKLREVKDSEIRASVLEQQSLALKTKLRDARDKIRGHNSKKLRSLQKRLEEEVRVLNKEHHQYEVQTISLQSLAQTEKELDVLRKHYTHRDPPHVVEKRLKGLRSRVAEYSTYKIKLEQYLAAIAALERKLSAIKLPRSSQEVLLGRRERLDSKIESLTTLVGQQRDKEREFKRLSTRKASLHESIQELDCTATDLKRKVASRISILEAALEMRALLDHKHLDGSICPTCRSEVDLHKIRAAIARAEKELPRLRQIQKAQQLHKQYQEVSSEIRELDFDPRGFSANQEKLSHYKELRESVEEGLAQHHEYRRVQKQLSEHKLTKPKVVEKPSFDMDQKQLDQELDLCSDILQHLGAKAKLIELHPEFKDLRTSSVIAQYARKVKSLKSTAYDTLVEHNAKLADVTQQLSELQSKRHEYNLYVKEYKQCNEELQSLIPAIEKKKLFESLVKAYGARGLRTLVISRLCGLIEDNLNHYRNLVFSEPFIFTLKASEQGVSILVDRGNGVVSDVRNLSGAESNCFRMLFILSILPLLPSDKRTNFLVLDEPTAHHDEVTRTLFRERFLPSICELVPHVFCITPNPDDYSSNSSEWLVQKKDGVSTLLKV